MSENDGGKFCRHLRSLDFADGFIKKRIAQVLDALNVSGVLDLLMDDLDGAKKAVREAFKDNSLAAAARASALEQWRNYCRRNDHDHRILPEFTRSI